MVSEGVFRNVNIITELNADNTTQALDIYSPGSINPYDIISGIKYSGFITSLRLTVDISSIPELELPLDDPLDTESDKEAKEREVIYSTPRKCIALYLRNSSSKPVLIGEILLFNRRPHYFINLLKYFSDARTFDVAPDSVITIQMKNVGYGLLESNDKIAVIGSSVEEAPLLNAPRSEENVIEQLPMALPNQYTHWHDDSIIISGGDLVFIGNTNHPYLNWFIQAPASDTDSFKFFAPLVAGNYRLTILGIVNSDLGILSLSVDGVNQFSDMDWYSFDFALNIRQSRIITLVGDRNHEFVFSVNSKNPDSAYYFMGLTKFSLVKV